MTRRFIDTNIFVYAFSDDPRSEVAEQIITDAGDLSVQVLNEFTNVARRKLGMSWPETRDALAQIRLLCPLVHPIDDATHSRAVALAERYDLSFYDALIVAAALIAGCDNLVSEDMQHGQLVEGSLRIVNPFV